MYHILYVFIHTFFLTYTYIYMYEREGKRKGKIFLKEFTYTIVEDGKSKIVKVGQQSGELIIIFHVENTLWKGNWKHLRN